MKKTLFVIVIFSFSLSAFGQTTDTSFVSISQEEAAFEKPRFINQYANLFGTKQPTRLLLKLNLVAALVPFGQHLIEDNYDNYNDLPGSFADISKIELGIEWKVLRGLSIHASGMIPTTLGSTYIKGADKGRGIRFEPRWYYNMPRRIRAGQSANNVSGDYIGVEYQTFWQDGLHQEQGQYFEDYYFQTVSLRYGLQRRLGRFGYVDANIGAGYQQSSATAYAGHSGFLLSSIEEGFFLETRVAAGLAFGAPRTTKSDISFCDILRCFQEDRHLWKIGLTKALRLDHSAVITNPKASYEQKIGSSSFSVEMEGELFLSAYRLPDYGYWNSKRDKLQLEKHGFGINVQPRWYFLQRQRIAKGKSGNNLAGLFGGLMGGYRLTKLAGLNNTIFNRNNTHLFYFAPHVGIQQRLFQHGFINYKLGLIYGNFHYHYPDPPSVLSELQVGFAF